MPRATRTAARIGATNPTVSYRDAKGIVRDAKVVSAGAGADQLNLKIPQGAGGTRTLTNVPRATAAKQTNVWFVRP